MDLDTAVALALLPARAGLRSVAALQECARAGLPSGDDLLQDVLARFGVTPADLTPRRAEALGHLSRAAERQIECLAWFDPRYPGWLAAIPDPPPVLWIRGRPAAFHGAGIAIVGSRAATSYARSVAAQLGTDLARSGVPVISGLARGVDGAAHRGALDGGGPTVAVFGSGPDVVYPAEHGQLAGAILEAGGALVSELVPGAPPRPGHFPLRNRLISGLSRAVVVVEASEKSGSLITARYALDQGRDVMAVPGNALSGRNRGAHALIRDGARIVETAADILEEVRVERAAGQDVVAEPLLAQLADGEGYELDELSRLLNQEAGALLARLLGLELAGLVTREGSRFVRSR
jgi:DNA processing protein